MREVRWQGAGKITSGTFKIFHAGGADHETGVALIMDQDMAKKQPRILDTIR